jgi:hypothetical protein
VGESGTDDSVESAALVALGSLIRSLGLAGAELTKVFGCLGNSVFEEFKSDAA